MRNAWIYLLDIFAPMHLPLSLTLPSSPGYICAE